MPSLSGAASVCASASLDEQVPRGGLQIDRANRHRTLVSFTTGARSHQPIAFSLTLSNQQTGSTAEISKETGKLESFPHYKISTTETGIASHSVAGASSSYSGGGSSSSCCRASRWQAAPWLAKTVRLAKEALGWLRLNKGAH